jgi:hypothetical protein
MEMSALSRSLVISEQGNTDTNPFPWIFLDQQLTDSRLQFLSAIKHLGDSMIVSTRDVAQLLITETDRNCIRIMRVGRFTY